MQRSSQTAPGEMSEDTVGVLQGLVADGVITSYELNMGSGGRGSLSITAPPGSDPLETEAAVKAAIRKDWSVSCHPAGPDGV